MRLKIVWLVALLISACGNGGTGDSDSAALDSSFTCDGLADRWVVIQQEYLDRLGNADAKELDEGTDRVDSAQQWVSQAMLEQVRDAQAVGCAGQLSVGAAALCSRVVLLEPGGGAADSVVETFRDGCVDPQEKDR